LFTAITEHRANIIQEAARRLASADGLNLYSM